MLPVTSAEADEASEPAPPPVPPLPPPVPPPGKVEARNTRSFPDSVDAKTTHMVFELHNAGPGPASLPRGQAMLLITNGLALDKATCTPHIRGDVKLTPSSGQSDYAAAAAT